MLPSDGIVFKFFFIFLYSFHIINIKYALQINRALQPFNVQLVPLSLLGLVQPVHAIWLGLCHYDTLNSIMACEYSQYSN